MENIEIKEISKNDAKNLISKFHYLGSKGFLFKVGYGLFVDQILVGAAVYHGPSAPETVVGAFGLNRTEQTGIWELGRLVLDPTKNGSNYGSMLIGRSIRSLKKKHSAKALITYAESDRHYGAIYQATNFKYCGLTKPKKDFYLPNGTKKERGKTKGIQGEWRDRPRKHRYIMIFDKNLSLKWAEEPYYKKPKLEHV